MTTYKQLGYTCELNSSDYGDFVTIRRNDKIVGEVALIDLCHDNKASMVVKRFDAKELRKVSVVIDFDQ